MALLNQKKPGVLLFMLLVFLTGSSYTQDNKKAFPVLKDQYLGQKPPGLIPEVFAPGIVSIEKGKEYKITFSPDLKEIIFTRRTPKGGNDRLWHCRFENGRLTTPGLVPFGYDCFEPEASFTPDGNGIYFASMRPIPGEKSLSRMPNIWFVNKTGNGWSEPQFQGSPLNDYIPVYFSFENDGTLYFTNFNPREIYTSKLNNGEYTEFTRLPDEINYLREVAHPAVAPDGSCLIVDSFYEENDKITGSMYISFRKPDGSWTKAVSMKDVFNSVQYSTARITPDGKYIFFEKYIQETDKSDIYWVDAKIIEKLKPDELR